MPFGFATAFYIASIVLVNWLFVALQGFPVLGAYFPPAVLFVGLVFIARDYSQREIGHYVLAATLLAGLITYFAATPAVAVASVTAFLISETIDWAIFTITKRPLSQRILLSSAVAVPADSIAFLYLVGLFDWGTVVLVSIGKFMASLAVWAALRRRERSPFIAMATK